MEERKTAKLRKLTEEEIRDYIEQYERKMTCICTACESLCFESDKYCANCGAELEDEA